MTQGPYNVEGLPSVRAGAAQVEITPPLGTSLAGYFTDRVSDAVADPLFARVVVIETGDERMALISCDVICLTRETVDPAKDLIAQQCGISPERVLICATHTHTGPNMRCKGKQVIPTNTDWLDTVPGLISEAVEAACADMFDAVLVPGRQSESAFGSNRLGRRRDGAEVFGKDQTIGAAGPIDPEVLALAVREYDGTVRAMVVNHAMHADATGGTHISAGWPGKVGRTVADVYGPQAVTVFLNGCCGDINHHHWVPKRVSSKGQLRTDQMGRGMAGLAVNAVEMAEPVEEAAIAGRLRRPLIPWYTRDDAMRAEVEVLRAQAEISPKDSMVIDRFDEWPYDGQMAEVTVQAIRLGDMLFIGLPGEIFTKWGLEIKHWSPAQFTFVAELANDWFGYIPTSDQAYRGAYGAKPILSRRLDADGGRQMTDAVQIMMWDLWEGRP
ncbi:MAG: hypothetical protein HOJ57_14715 [Lentisphaerae bacterium]|jgi:neutral ceramidase|nr:hypothetical protein [Lentisphaerota bacterium]MBT4817423.1 hypothetical protein [Lentisphaerota bacterium]MBT5607189.1 hypothetical protein [Lentisphaerota bacterium]MBT7060022.1 hypothetical protein [Lentisphaerota bacterium]